MKVSAALAADVQTAGRPAHLPWLAAWARAREAVRHLLGVPGPRESTCIESADERTPWCAVVAAPRVHREPAAHAQGRPALTIAIEGHLLHQGGAAALEGAEAAQAVWSIYRREGVAGFAKLGGNFAIVLADPCEGLWLVRDAVGCKSLFGTEVAGGVRVAGGSAVEVARAAGDGLRCEPQALRRYLATGHAALAGPTMLAGVRVLPPGQATGWLASGEERCVMQRAIALRDSAALSIETAGEAWMQRTIAICAAQSAAGGVGVALSGGMDSSGLLAALRAAGRAQVPCFTFCHERDDLPSQWNEREFAQAAARECGGRWHAVTMSAAELPSMLDTVARWQDFPSGSPVVLAQARLNQAAAAAGVRRLLTGHGPDTLLGGGDSQLIARAAELLGRGRIGAAGRLLRGALAYSNLTLPHLTVATLVALLPHRAIRRSVAAQVDAQLHRDVVPVSLQIEECNARACGIDNRSPYLVRELVEFALGLAPDVAVAADGRTKAVLRRALQGHVPAPIVARQRAIGFAVPVLPWLLESESWLRERLDAVAALHLSDAPMAAQVLPILRRRNARAWREAFRAWRWISLAAWMQAHDVRG